MATLLENMHLGGDSGLTQCQIIRDTILGRNHGVGIGQIRKVGGVFAVTDWSAERLFARSADALSPRRLIFEPIWVQGSLIEITG